MMNESGEPDQRDLPQMISYLRRKTARELEALVCVA